LCLIWSIADAARNQQRGELLLDGWTRTEHEQEQGLPGQPLRMAAGQDRLAAGRRDQYAGRLIGGLSVSRPGLALTVARRSRREMASLPSRLDGQF
jgi:hypothetical protein